MTINVIPRNQTVNDQTLEQYIIRFWQGLCPISKNQSPAWDNDGSKDVPFNNIHINDEALFMLCFPRFPQAAVTRNCEIPSSKGLFIPVMSVEVSQCEKPGATENQLRVIANKDQASIAPSSLRLELDSVPLANLSSYRFNASQIDIFDVTFPTPEAEAIFPISSTSCRAAAAGHYIWTESLSPGEHTIHWEGNLHCSPPGECIDTDYMENITYNVTAI